MSNIAIEAPRRRSRFTRIEGVSHFQVTDRDIEIVRQVARHRFLRSTHISKLLDAPHKKILERLTPLYRTGYLDRPRAQLEYHVRGGGSAPLVYALGNRGAQLLLAQDGCDKADIDWSYRNRETGREFILHTLAVADMRVGLAAACRQHGVLMQSSHQLLAGLPKETRTALNPWAWRVKVNRAGSDVDVGVLPDYVFMLLLPDGRRRAFFVECDRGTMPIERSTLNQTSMMRKFLAYESTHKQGLHTARFGWKAFRTLIITQTESRAPRMRRLIERAPVLKGSRLFLFAEHAMLSQSNILGSCWSDSAGTARTLI